MAALTRNKLLKLAGQIAIYCAIFFVLATAADLWRGRNLPKPQIPAETYQLISGNKVNLHELSQESMVVVYFWATWCGPCKATSPSVSALSKHYPVVSIAMESGPDSELLRYQKETGYGFSIINDAQRVISNRWRIPVTPVVLFVKDGKIKDYSTGISTYPFLLARSWWASL